MAEVNLGSGLGDVIAQTGHGIVLRTKPGAPGIGEINCFDEDVFVAYKTFGPIETSEIITNPDYKNIISVSGEKYLSMFQKSSVLDDFLSFSYNFSRDTKLMTSEVESLINYFNSMDDILGSSMAMLGNTVFAFAYDESVFRDLEISDLYIDKLNTKGIIYD